MDFTTAWKIAKATPAYLHDPRCSYYVTRGGVMCDCHVITIPELREKIQKLEDRIAKIDNLESLKAEEHENSCGYLSEDSDYPHGYSCAVCDAMDPIEGTHV